MDYSTRIEDIETIGTLLFHIAAIEYSWMYVDIFGEKFKINEWKYAFGEKFFYYSQVK